MKKAFGANDRALAVHPRSGWEGWSRARFLARGGQEEDGGARRVEEAWQRG